MRYLRQVRSRRLRLNVVVEARRGAAGEDRGRFDARLVQQVFHHRRNRAARFASEARLRQMNVDQKVRSRAGGKNSVPMIGTRNRLRPSKP